MFDFAMSGNYYSMEKTILFFSNLMQYLKLNYINLGLIILFAIIGYLTAEFIKHRIMVRLNKKSPNPITATFISQIISFALKTFVVLITLYLLGLNSFTNKILAGAGLLTFVIGFALKDIGENFLAGIVLAFKSPFKLNDLIEVNNIIGFVKDFTIRETQIKTPDGKDVFLPNSIILKNPMFNYTIDGFLRYEFIVGIDYENNSTEAIKLIIETVNNVEGVLKGERKPAVVITELAASMINIKVMFWVDTFQTTRRSVHNNIRSQVMNDVVAALIGNGFSLPASIVELKNYEPSGLLHLKIESGK
jgi:small-conductance mechanosensitive channel